MNPFAIDPASDGLIGDHDPTLGQQILDIPEIQGKPDIKPDRLLDDFGPKAETTVAVVPSSMPTGQTERAHARNAVTIPLTAMLADCGTITAWSCAKHRPG